VDDGDGAAADPPPVSAPIRGPRPEAGEAAVAVPASIHRARITTESVVPGIIGPIF
jgi:hypothetical protein